MWISGSISHSWSISCPSQTGGSIHKHWGPSVQREGQLAAEVHHLWTEPSTPQDAHRIPTPFSRRARSSGNIAALGFKEGTSTDEADGDVEEDLVPQGVVLMPTRSKLVQGLVCR